MSIDIKADITSAQTVEEFDLVLEKYKLANPAKYALKVANGELEKFKKTLIGYVAEEKVLSKQELIALAEEKGLTLEGTESKNQLKELLGLN